MVMEENSKQEIIGKFDSEVAVVCWLQNFSSANLCNIFLVLDMCHCNSWI